MCPESRNHRGNKCFRTQEATESRFSRRFSGFPGDASIRILAKFIIKGEFHADCMSLSAGTLNENFSKILRSESNEVEGVAPPVTRRRSSVVEERTCSSSYSSHE